MKLLEIKSFFCMLACIIFFSSTSALAQPVSREIPALDRAVIIASLKEYYGPHVKASYEAILSVADPEDKAILKNITPTISDDDVPFAFFGGPGINYEDKPAIVATIGGLRSISIISTADVVGADVLNDGLWLVDYFLLIRKNTKIGARSPDPLRAAGMTCRDLTDAQFNKILGSEMMLLTFILAHEAGHVINQDNPMRKPGETESKWLERRKGQERAADEYALEIVRRLKQIPLPICSLYTSWMVMYQGSTEPLLGSTHPASSSRLKNVVQFISQNIDDWGLEPKTKDEVVKVLENAKRASMIFNDPSVSDDMDKRAESVTETSLKRPLPRH